MKQMQKLLTAITSFIFMSTYGHTMEVDQPSDDLYFSTESTKKRPVFYRANASTDLERHMHKQEHAKKQRVMISPRITFPTNRDSIVHCIQEGYTTLHFYIPRNHNFFDGEQKITFSLGDIDTSNVTRLIIEHSAGDSSGYWPAAVHALAQMIPSFRNLVAIALSNVVVEDIIGKLPFGTSVHLETSRHYADSDTMYPTDLLLEWGESYRAYCQETYNMYPFYVIPLGGSPAITRFK